MTRAGHTPADYRAYLDVGLVPADHQPREHAIHCVCGAVTWNRSGTCDAHYEPPASVRAAWRDLAHLHRRAVTAIADELAVDGPFDDQRFDDDPESPF